MTRVRSALLPFNPCCVYLWDETPKPFVPSIWWGKCVIPYSDKKHINFVLNLFILENGNSEKNTLSISHKHAYFRTMCVVDDMDDD